MSLNKTELANIIWDKTLTPLSSQFDDIYFSRENGLAESRYVFIEANRLLERWKSLNKYAQFTIGETGFGTGLNFLATWEQWIQHGPKNGAHLNFISVEKYPLSAEQLLKALTPFKEINALAKQLIENYPPQPTQGIHRMNFNADAISLTLCIGEAKSGLESLLCTLDHSDQLNSSNVSFGGPCCQVDAWYLDGFAPNKNPDMWNDELLHLLTHFSQPNHTTFATFTAAGQIRRSLIQLGFECQKIKGFAQKREQLVGVYSEKKNLQYKKAKEQTWHAVKVTKKSQLRERAAVVIGGGLAGCHTAAALAQQHFNVCIVEQEDDLARGASGNQQGIVYTKLSPDENPLCRFNLTAQIFANHFYSSNKWFDKCGEQCGVFHLPVNEREWENFKQIASQFSSTPSFSRWVDQKDTQEITGAQLENGGLFLPQSGWLNPPKLCRALSNHERISVINNTKVQHLSYHHDCWELFDDQENAIAAAPIVIIANATDAKALTQTQYLPLKNIRGQVTHVSAQNETQQLKAAVCGRGYIAPADHAGMHCLGASFTLNNDANCETLQEHKDNLENIEKMFDHFCFTQDAREPSALTGKVGFRSTSPDYLPIVGPVPDKTLMYDDFFMLSKNANRMISKTGSYLPNLYCNLAHGSRGLAYTPLAAQILVSVITGGPLPIEKSLFLHLHPARFIIRNLIRNKF